MEEQERSLFSIGYTLCFYDIFFEGEEIGSVTITKDIMLQILIDELYDDMIDNN